jgi:hypothetical protein
MLTYKTQDGLMAHVIVFFKIMFEPTICCCFHVFPVSDSGSDLWHSFHGLPAYLETDVVGAYARNLLMIGQGNKNVR